MHFDCIYVMHEGQMIASGTHSYLLSNNAYYKALWQQQ
jgi:ABC-type multidrug transport system fused ATPase/permease subunit